MSLTDFLTQLTSGAGFLLIVIGFICAVIPVLPGSILVYTGMFVYAASTGYTKLSLAWLVVLGVIAAISWASEWILTTLIARRTGATWKTILGAVLGGLVGAGLLSALLPIVGTLIGAALGTAAGVLLMELYLKRELASAAKTSGAYLGGCFASRLVELSLCLLMLLIFLWQIGAQRQ
jgi:hypothetical protein